MTATSLSLGKVSGCPVIGFYFFFHIWKLVRSRSNYQQTNLRATTFSLKSIAQDAWLEATCLQTIAA